MIATVPLARVRLDGAGQAVITTGRGRVLFLVAVFAAAFTLLGARLVSVSLFGDRDFRSVARAGETGPGGSARADIVDRNGMLIATSLRTHSLYADATLIRRPAAAAGALVTVLGDLDYTKIYGKLSSGKSFVWLKRNLTPTQVYDVNRIGNPGFKFERERKRIYPQGALTAHAVGYVGIDNDGLAGVERALDHRLRAEPATPLVLSLDLRFQHALRTVLAEGRARFSAKGASGIILDVRTAETLALVSLPDFDPNRPGSASDEGRFNRATLGVHEMGSTFKVLTLAMALDANGLTFMDGFDATKPLRIARRTIRDYHGKRRWLAVPEILIYSSNIGAAKMALSVGAEAQRAFLGRLGLLSRPAIEVAEVGAPITPNRWGDIETATVSFGHGIAVSSIQLASATAALVNGGTFRQATLLKADVGEGAEGARVVSSQTSDRMRHLLRLVVTQGTGGKADVEGYLVGGKTGTAEKVGPGGYDRKRLVSSFLAAFPMDAPRYVVLIVLDEPQGIEETHNYATGGWTAAPMVGDVIGRIGPIAGIPRTPPPAAEMHMATKFQRKELGNEIRLAAN